MLKTAVGFLCCGAAGTVSGVAARAVYWHVLGVSVVTEQTLMPIGVMVGVGSTLLIAGWFGGRTIRGFEDKIDELGRRLEEHIKDEKHK